MGIDLSVIWFVIIAFGILMYIVMDGFDLGIGILMPFVRNKVQKDTMVNSVAPVWDGNETWMVLGGAALFGAFPLAYAVIIDALSIPLTLMLIALIFRGVAFEFRFKATESHRPFWDHAFFWGSLITAFCQGVSVGAIINGFPVNGRTFAGSVLDWVAPFPLFCGFALVIAYALLGSTWLIMKTENTLQAQMYKLTKPLLGLLLVCLIIISIWTPLSQEAIAQRWFSLPNLYFLLPVPLVTLICAWQILSGIKNKGDAKPFIMTLILVLMGFSGLGISLWPNIIPPSISIWDASSPPQSQGFMLVGALFIIPFILMYTFWSYYVFHGKVKDGEGYH